MKAYECVEIFIYPSHTIVRVKVLSLQFMIFTLKYLAIAFLYSFGFFMAKSLW